MKTKLLVFFLILQAQFIFAFPVSIKGNINPAISNTLRIQCAGWVEDILINTDAAGNFLFKTDISYPSEFLVSVDNNADLAYKFFVFESGTITLSISDASRKEIRSEGESERSRAFGSIESLLFGPYVEIFKKQKNAEAGLQEITRQIKMIPNIGKDQYTDMIADCAGIVLMSNMFGNDGKPLYDIGTIPLLKELMKNHTKFSGFEFYNSLVWPVWLEQLKTAIRTSQNREKDYTPKFTDLLALAEERKNEVSLRTFVNTKYGILMFVRPETLNEKEKTSWLAEVQRFCNDYPQYPFTSYLGMQYQQATQSLIGNLAPDFILRDINGKEVALSDFKGKYLLIDVWGSWCLPCRQMNKELVLMYSEYQNKNIAFVSVAYDKDIDKLQNAIKKDRLTWPQLVYNDQFLKNYNVFSYPTLFLISPDREILKIAHHFDKTEIDAVLNNK